MSFTAPTPQHFQSLHFGKAEVENSRIEIVIGAHGISIEAVVRALDREPGLGQPGGNPPGDLVVILNHQDANFSLHPRSLRSSWSCAGDLKPS